MSESIQANGNIEEIYAGTLAKSSALSSSNLKKVVSPEFPDDTFILGSAIDYVASASEWVAGSYGQLNQGGNNSSVSPAALPGLFTINEDGDQVRFSKGNLRCYINESGEPTADPSNSPNTTGWAFADNQYDYIGNIAPNNDPLCGTAGWIDSFCWSTDSGTKAWGINNSLNYSDYSGDFVDWGTNQIYNGTSMDPANTWYTLSIDNYYHLINTRDAVTVHGIANARCARGTVASKKGLILFPDAWVAGSELSEAMQDKVGTAIINNSGSGDFTSAVITSDEWDDFEAAGCVFLFAAGQRHISEYYPPSFLYLGEYVQYWTSTPGSDYDYWAHRLYCSVAAITYFDMPCCTGYAVRLVQNVE